MNMIFRNGTSKELLDFVLNCKDINETEPISNENMLHKAIANNRVDIIDTLINGGIDINHKNILLETPLIMACREEKIDIAIKLIEAGANVNNTDSFNETALHIAARKNLQDVIKLLIEKGINLDVQNSLGETALHIATRLGHTDIVKMLVINGANKDMYDKKMMTPLYIAVSNDDIYSTTFLIERGANINVASKHQETLLHKAIRKGFYDITQILIDNNIDITAVNDKGYDPLCLASKLGRENEVELLLTAKELNKGYNSKEDKTALFYATQKNYDGIVNMFLFKRYKDLLNIIVNKNCKNDKQKENLDYITKKSMFLEYLSKDGMEKVINKKTKALIDNKKKQEIVDILVERNNIKNFNNMSL